MTYPCPHCRATADAETGCPSCGRAPDPDAIEVIRTDTEIAGLYVELTAARQVVAGIEMRIGQAFARRNDAAARIRARLAPPAVPTSPETSTRVVQNVLFLLGGLLLAVAAIVFTAVAWAQFGVAGRAAILGVVTLAALAGPVLALRRGLTAAAETVAALGLLLTLLDGYAAWYVNLFGVAGGDPQRYAGVVCALTAVIAAGYARLTGLTGPRYAALLVAQPALPLLVAPADPGPAGWSLTLGVLAALDIAVRRARVATAAYVCGGLALIGALIPAVLAAGRTIDTAGPVFHAAWTARVPAEGWPLPAALVVVTAAMFGAVPARLRPLALLGGAAAVAVSVPAGLHLPWWNGPLFDLVVVAAALALAVRHTAPLLHVPAARVAALPVAASPSAAHTMASAAGRGLPFAVQLVTAVLLGLHAITAGFGRPAMAAAVLAVIALFGLATAALARHPGLAGAGLLAGMLVAPGIAWTATAALGLDGAWQVRAVAGTATLLVLALRAVPELRKFALVGALLSAVPLPLWALVAGQTVSVYAAVGLLLVALTSRLSAGDGWATESTDGAPPAAPGLGSAAGARSAAPGWGRASVVAAVPLGVALVAAVAPAFGRVLRTGDPIFAGRPDGVPAVAVSDAVAVVILAVAVFLVRRSRWDAAAVLALAVPLVLAAAGAPWPVIPFAELALGLAGLLLAALRGTEPGRGIGVGAGIRTVAWAGAVLTVAGVSGALPTRVSELVALGAVLAAAAVVGTAGRTATIRVFGCAVAAAASLGVAATAPAGAVLEAYTIPAAVVALAASLLAKREPRPSWVVFGPALVAALLPSLLSVLGGDGQQLRRLLLGLAALAVLLAGARFRLRAPVVLGGGTLALVALHELAVVWELVPRWIPLAAAGVLLVVLATTLERRRRDLHRFRQALSRMA